MQFTIGQDTHDKLRYAQELLSHQIPSGDLAAVLDRALRAPIPQLERQTFAGTGRPRPDRPRRTANPRSIPAPVQRAVWQRDGGQCTRAAAQAQARDVMAGLRELGFRADQARRAAEFAETLPDATLEQRMRAALKFLCPRTRSQGRVETSAAAPT